MHRSNCGLPSLRLRSKLLDFSDLGVEVVRLSDRPNASAFTLRSGTTLAGGQFGVGGDWLLGLLELLNGRSWRSGEW